MERSMHMKAGRGGVADGQGFYRYDAEGTNVGVSDHLGLRE